MKINIKFKHIYIALFSLSFLYSCESSIEEKQNIATITCNIMAESRNMDGAMRLKEINSAREKINAEPYLANDYKIKESFKYGLCEELVLLDDAEYENYLSVIKEQERTAQDKERDRISKEKRDEEIRIAKQRKEMNMQSATISTTAGDIKIELDHINAPVSVENFISLANSGYYTDTIFHRIIEGFMIQGGGLDADMQNKPSDSDAIKNEANNGLKNDRGTIAMARTMDPHSATSQFFINHADNDFLNFSSETTQGWGYAVFGKVIEGMEVVDSIALSPTMVVNGYQDAPANPVTINSVSISE